MKRLSRLVAWMLTIMLLTGELGAAGLSFNVYAAEEDGVEAVDGNEADDTDENDATAGVSEDSVSDDDAETENSVSSDASVSDNADENEYPVTDNPADESSDGDVDEEEYEIHKAGLDVKDGKVYDKSSGAYLGTFDDSTGTLVLYKELETIPSEVFRGWKDLKKITFEEGSKAKTIGLSGGATFSGCVNLEEVDMSMADNLTTIKANSFYGCTALQSVIFNSNLNFIEAGAFQGCSSLEEITLPENFKKLSSGAFKNCKNLQKITVKSDAFECESGGAFGGCSISSCVFEVDQAETLVFPAYLFINAGFAEDAEIEIDERIAEIGISAFKASNIKHVKLAANGKLKAIDKDAFNGCKVLEDLDFSTSTELQSIGESAFAMCNTLNVISFRNCNKLTTFGNNVFKQCGSLTKVEMPVGATGANKSDLGSSLFEKCVALEEVKLPYAQEYISQSEFKDCPKLSVVVFTNDYDSELDSEKIGILEFGNCVKEIGSSAFSGCNSFKEVIMSDSLVLLGNNTFYGCEGLKKVTFPSTADANDSECFTKIPNSCFENCINLLEAELIEGITEIGDNAFKNCHCYSATLPVSLTHIGNSAFYMCSFSGVLVLPENINYIGNAAFMHCEDQTGANNYTKLRKVIIKPLDIASCGTKIFNECYLEEFELAPGVTRVPANLFNQASWKTETPITIPATVKEIGRGAFAGDVQGNVGNLKEIIFETGSQLEVIEDGAFRYNSAVGSIELPITIDSIGANAFADCIALKGIVIPENVTYMGDGAFANCSLLETVEFNALKAEKAGKTFGKNIFQKCNIKTVTVGPGVTVFPDYLLYGAQFQKNEDGNYILHELFMPASVTKIGQYSLTNVVNVDTIVFEDNSSLTEIGQYAMSGCIALTDINLSAAMGLSVIGQYAFSGCKALKVISLPDSVAKINNYVFSDCEALESAVLPTGLQTLGAGVFKGCANLTEVNIPAMITVVDRELCSGCKSLNKLTFTGTKVTSIGDSAFLNCIVLTEVAIPKSVTRIGTGAFKGCPLSGTIELAEGVTSLGNYAFDSAGSNDKTKVYLPSTLKTIGQGAFSVSNKDNLEFYAAAGSYAETWLINNGFGDRLAYTVKFNMMGHGEEIADIGVLKGQAIAKPDDPAEEGWVFGGWYTDRRCTKEYDFTAAVTNSFTLYAKWSGVIRTVSFNMNGKTVKEVPESQVVENGKTASRPAKDPEADGFMFTGWYTTAACEETELYDFKTPVTADITLYAGWSEVNKHTVTFDMNGKSGATDVPEVQYVDDGKTAAKPEKDPSLEGFIFGGWYKEADCINIFDFSAKISSDTIIYAKWIEEEEGKYKVTFDLNGKAGTVPEVQVVEKGKTASRPENDPSAEGFLFTGWYTEKECVNEFDFSTVITQSITLYAGWNEVKYFTVTFNMNGMTGVSDVPQEQKVEEGGVIVKPEKNPSIEGFKFVGWYKEEDCINVFDFAMKISADTVVYAKWVEITTDSFTVTFDLNGKPGAAPETQIVEKDMTATRPETDPSAEGFEFTGWYTERECENAYDFSSAVTQDITLYAGWKEAESKEPASALNKKPVIDDDTKAIYLVKGQKFTLGTGWVSSDKKILSISKKGVATAKKATVSPVKLKKGTVEIDVYIIKPEIQKSLTFNAGEGGDVAILYDKNMPIYWYSASPDVATVDQNGHVTAVSKGSAKISAYINGTAYTCKVKVKENAAVLSRTIHMLPGQSKSFKLKGGSGYVWKSADSSIVLVNKNKFVAKNPGHTEVTAELNGNAYVVDVYVEDITVSIKGIQSKGKNKYTLDAAQNSNIEVSIKEVYQAVVFKSTKPESAYIDEFGKLVTGSTGKAKLTAKINGKTITITVNVR